MYIRELYLNAWCVEVCEYDRIQRLERGIAELWRVDNVAIFCLTNILRLTAIVDV